METKLIAPIHGATVPLHTQIQRQFGKKEVTGEVLKAHDWLALSRSEHEDHTFPLTVTFTWETDAPRSVFELAQTEDFSDSVRIQTENTEITVDNLFVRHPYFWRVNGCEPFAFTTEDVAPRWLFVEGLSNFRDNGNWKTLDGRRTKQGLLYRGTEMDIHHAITKAGRWTMVEELKIKTDLDLRGESIGSPLGDKVQFLQVLAGPYQYFINNDKTKCKQIFDILADRENYPVYLHCWGGADRTGSIFFILNAMLGVAEEDLLLDFELTSLSIWGERSRNSELFHNFENALNAYGEAHDSVQVKATRYLLDCGVTEQQMEEIRSILVG